MSEDARGGRPLVAHVVVLLCDNEYQGCGLAGARGLFSVEP